MSAATYREALIRAHIDLEQLAALLDLIAEDVAEKTPVRAQLVMDMAVKAAEAARDRAGRAYE